ncbi:MAG: sugar phosphate isomerase/epimerase family protein [Planctomycetota bacterium]
MVRQTGLDAVQLDLTPLVRDQAAWGTCVDALRHAGIRIVSGMMAPIGEDYSSLESIARTGGVRPDDHWDDNRQLANAMATLAAEAGIPLVTLHAGFLPESTDDPERATMLDRLRELARAFAARGVNLAFETGQESASTLIEVLTDLHEPNVGVNFDPANMILYATGDPIDALDQLRPWVHQVHIKDAIATTVPGTWGAEVPVGHGDVDWNAFFEVVTHCDPPVVCVIEREAGTQRIEDIVKAKTLVETLWERAR